MDPILLASSEDRYGSFSSAEQAEHNMIRDGLNTSRPELHLLNPLDFESIVSSLQVEKFGEAPENIFSLQPSSQSEGSSPFTGTPSSSNCDLATPTSTPCDFRLTLPTEHQSFSPYIEPFSAFDLSSLSSLIMSVPTSLGKGDSSLHGSESNALGLLEGSDASSESMFLSAPGFLPSSPNPFIESTEQQTAVLDLSGNFVLSAILDQDLVLADETDLQLPFGNHTGLRATAPFVPQVELGAGYEPQGTTSPASSSDAAISPESLNPSLPSTPEKLAVQLPDNVPSDERATRARPIRTTAAKCQPCQVRNTTRLPANQIGRSSTSSSSHIAQVTSSADECEYGWRVWVTEGGHRVSKWKCRFCEQLVGRRPDLHRHYKTCVVKTKFICEDVLHADGSVWIGCGQKFSRRDACHRHLKKRFTEGRCMRKAPKKERCENEDDYITKMVCYEDMSRNYKWRAALPASEKNRMVKTALSHIKQDMF